MKKIIIGIIISIGIIMITGILAIVYLLNMIPYDHLAAALVSNIDNVPAFIYEKAQENSKEERNYADIPTILTLNDGTKVNTSQEFHQRQQEMLKILETEVYGTVPDVNYNVEYQLLEQNNHALDDTAIRQQIKMNITTEVGSSESIILLYLPKDVENVPIFLGLNVAGNITTTDDLAVIPSNSHNDLSEAELTKLRGSKSSRWPISDIIERGNGFMTIHCDDFAPNNKDHYQEGLIKLFTTNQEETEFKTISAWSFGLSRAIDYLNFELNDTVNQDKIMTVGHSRFGKTALWTAAQDERVAVAFANASGTAGSALSRENSGETVQIINTMFPHWFVDKFNSYNENETKMPFDQHFLLSTITPRQVYLSNGINDFWADPIGEYNTLRLTAPVYQLFNSEIKIPEIATDTSLSNQFFGYHLIDKNHQFGAADWKYYLEYVDNFVN